MPPPVTESAETGVKRAGQILAAASGARWPMYLRNIKQILRAGGFDERRYGFGGLMDILRACQKEGLIRLERDRRGGLRVFQGAAIARAPEAAASSAPAPVVDIIDPAAPMDAMFEPVEVSSNGGAEADLDFDLDIEPQPAIVVDTTAELLGRASGKSARAPRAARTAAPRKSAPKKMAASAPRRRSPRARKAAGSSS